VIEDSAQSFGATYKGRRSGSLSEISGTSFFPSKPLGGYGDGGACFTNDDHLAAAMREVRNHGQQKRYHHVRVGVNGRLDSLQCAILLSKMEVFPEELESRQRIGARYTKQIRELCGSRVKTPWIAPECTSPYAQYTVEVDDRDLVMKRLAERGVPTTVHYPEAAHLQPALKKFSFKKGDFPEAEKSASRVFSLPMHPYLNEADQDRVVQALKESL
jgi:UDP-2-acetamido-2-deoxy-ribo-hexuluronate aminotransferase